MKIPLLLVSCSALVLGLPIGKHPSASVNIVESQESYPQTTAVIPSGVYEPVVQTTRVPSIDKRFFGFRFRYYGAGIGPYRGYYRRRSEGSFRYTPRQRANEHDTLSHNSNTQTPSTTTCTHMSTTSRMTDTSNKKTVPVTVKLSTLMTYAPATATTIRIPSPTTPLPDTITTPTSIRCSECQMHDPPRGRPLPYKREIKQRWQTNALSDGSRTVRDLDVLLAATPDFGLPPGLIFVPPITLAVIDPILSTTSITVSGPTVTATVTVSDRLGNPPIQVIPQTSTIKATSKPKPTSRHKPTTAPTPRRKPTITSTTRHKPTITTTRIPPNLPQPDVHTRLPSSRVTRTIIHISTSATAVRRVGYFTKLPSSSAEHTVTREPMQTTVTLTSTSTSASPTGTPIKPTPSPSNIPNNSTDEPPDTGGDNNGGDHAPLRPFYVKRRARGRSERYPGEN
ncbi:hypothetical protein ABW21_db0206697 [Orbilia brochopaga]|nr:hypothetical protein ABW21_db0206697 [Drechslerella brochopaga]